MGQDHPQTQGCINSFADFLKKIIAAGQADQLSDHPVTQAILQAIS
ncbi:MAG: hypothetical protein F6K19_08220 [Cyanothece sp. SIO1E1]|nr:hypothetical protein [Cyanothece sp. SIO1E1]